MDPSRIEQEAATWVVAQDRGLTGSEQDEFTEWLAADPRHRAAYAEQKRAWNSFDLLEEWRPRHSAEPNPDILDRSVLAGLRRRRLRWMQVAGMAACLAISAGFAVRAWLERRVPTPAPSVASEAPAADLRRVSSSQTRYVALPDLSEIDLNEGTELVVEYTRDRRHVEVLCGEAFFTVAKDSRRPFDVSVGGATVRAVGTRFSVKLEAERVAVVVSEGHVLFGAAAALAAATPGTTPQDARIAALDAGDFSSLPLDAAGVPEIRELPEAETLRMLSWKPEVLDFASTPLEGVVHAFNERNAVQIIVADESLRHLPIVASFRANNVHGFINLIEVTGIARVERVSDTTIRLSAP